MEQLVKLLLLMYCRENKNQCLKFLFMKIITVGIFRPTILNEKREGIGKVDK